MCYFHSEDVPTSQVLLRPCNYEQYEGCDLIDKDKYAWISVRDQVRTNNNEDEY